DNKPGNDDNKPGNDDSNKPGNDDSNKPGNDDSNKPGSTGNNPVAGLPDINDNVIYLYSWNSEFGSLMEYFYDKYPEYKNLVVYKDLGLNSMDEAYINAVSSKIGSSSEPLSMVMYDGELNGELDDSRYATMESLGVEKYYKDAYEFTINEATFSGKLKGMSPYVCPSGFIYRKDIAEDVLGTSDPDEVRKFVDNWNSFADTAALMKEAGYYMLCSSGDFYRGCGLTSDKALSSSQQDIYNRFVNNGYFHYNEDKMWWTEWNDDMNGNIFGYFGGDWMISYVISSHTDYQWGFCPGPEYHHWGGSYIAVADDCPNKGLAALILYTLCCDKDVEAAYANNNWYTPNNMSAAQELISLGTLTCDTNICPQAIEKYNDEIARGIK
ncbi:MAG TPA: hypothetical protein DCY81_01350, partial [Lachnospiraceae bacterium]|nr:hypothetical protein [Lachnospiraceae bacterium]